MANPLYDPNYRQFDVEGYRIYRGRVDSPTSSSSSPSSTIRARSFRDCSGQVNPVPGCAPELGIDTVTVRGQTPPRLPGALRLRWSRAWRRR